MTDVIETSNGDPVAYDRYGEGPAVVLVAGAWSLRGNEEAATTAQLVARRGPDRPRARPARTRGERGGGVSGPRPEWLAGAKASPTWPAIYAGVVSLRADGQSLRWATAELESGALRDAVTVPVLSVYGTQTVPGMVEASDRLRGVLPQTEVRLVGGAHHAWDPTAFAPVLAEFAKSC